MLRIHCALKPEAAPINAFFGLNLLVRQPEYSLFGNNDLQLLLTGSGKGRVCDAFKSFDWQKWGQAIWFNIGIAGSAEFDLFTPVFVDTVTFEGRQGISIDNFNHVGALLNTVAVPSDDYPQNGLVDMELWHIKQLLVNQSLYSLKIVSDTPKSGLLSSKKDVKDCLRRNMSVIEDAVKKIKDICTHPNQ